MTGRGGGWVAAQFVLMPLIIVAFVIPPGWPSGARIALAVIGVVSGVGGGIVVYAAGRELGRGFTPFPEPPVDAALVETGPFRVIRHPTYAGALAFFLGWSLIAGPVALGLTGALAALWVGKIASEERRLSAKFTEYTAYTRRVRYRLLPGVF